MAFDMPEHAGSIVYTTDGSTPTSASTRYTGPFEVRDSMVISACAVGKGESPELSDPTVVELKRIEAGLVRVAQINFQTADAPRPDGYAVDTGAVFRQHNGASYGWSRDTSEATRKRGMSTDPIRDTLVHFSENNKWEIAMENGEYDLTVGFGDAQHHCQNQTIFVEGKTLVHT